MSQATFGMFFYWHVFSNKIADLGSLKGVTKRISRINWLVKLYMKAKLFSSLQQNLLKTDAPAESTDLICF
jgi:hypothetical protein